MAASQMYSTGKFRSRLLYSPQYSTAKVQTTGVSPM